MRPAKLSERLSTVRDLIDHMGSSKPNDTFLISPETRRSLTFGDLALRVRALSANLTRQGVRRGDKVAFMMNNGLDAATLFLGSMYGGFVIVPTNVRAGVAQIAFTLAHSDAKVVFVGDEYQSMLDEAMRRERPFDCDDQGRSRDRRRRRRARGVHAAVERRRA